MREGSGQLVLRVIEDRDLDVLFEHSTDREAIRMAAFTSMPTPVGPRLHTKSTSEPDGVRQ